MVTATTTVPGRSRTGSTPGAWPTGCTDMFRSKWTLEDVRPFIEAAPMFFLATADREGQPQCSYKGGAPGFVQILAPMELCFPSYDGNGMFLSFGNVLENPHIQMLFIDFEQPNRIRVSGRATITEDADLLASYRSTPTWCAGRVAMGAAGA